MTTAKNKPRSKLTLTEKAYIKEQQAPFIEKIATAIPNEQQEAIFEAAKTGAGCYVIIAGPGCGKTFSSIRASLHFTGKSIYFAYNKKIEYDANLKLVAIDSKMVAATVHSFGHSCLQAYTRGKCVVDEKEEKYPELLQQYLSEHWQPFAEMIKAQAEEDELDLGLLRADAFQWSKALVHFALVSLAEPSTKGIAALVEQFDLEEMNHHSPIWPFVVQATIFAIEQGKALFFSRHLVAFDDMVAYPVIIPGVPIRQHDCVIVDEAQDLSRAALELILKACRPESQVFFVGDPHQSIYLFAGAVAESMELIRQRVEAKTLPLQICYRFGPAIVKLANQLGGTLISAGQHESAVEIIEGDETYLDQVEPGDAIIARTTKWCVQSCLKVLQRGKRARVLGRNIGSNIAAIITALEAMRLRRGVALLTPDLANFLEVLEHYERQETKNLVEGRKKPEMALAELEDKVATARAFFEAYIARCHDRSRILVDDPRCAFDRTPKDFKQYIHGFFSDEDGTREFVLCLTAHRAKGSEWERVYVVGTEEFPHPRAKSTQQKQQEQNLMYVTVTRAIQKLFFVGAPFAGLSFPGYEAAESLPSSEPAQTTDSATVLEAEKEQAVHVEEELSQMEDFTSLPKNHIEKLGRAKKERKSNAGRKTKSGLVREPLQLSLDIKTIKALNRMGVNKSQLFEELLSHYEPFLAASSALAEQDEQQR